MFNSGEIACRECEGEKIVFLLRANPFYRQGFTTGLRDAYAEYRYSGGTLPAMKWAFKVLDGEIWNELFQARFSSHQVVLNGLTHADGQRIVKGY